MHLPEIWEKLLAQVRSAQQQAQEGQMGQAQATLGGMDLQTLQGQMGAQPTTATLGAVQDAYNSMTNAEIRQPQAA